MLTVIDNKTQNFLESCCDAESIDDINYGAMKSDNAINVYCKREQA